MKAWLRIVLLLGRLSSLPTIWSNCLAGWLLSGGGLIENFLALGMGTSCLYVGGMCLNHACDASVDAIHRPERPIPSGMVAAQTVILMAVVWFAVGALFLVTLGKVSAILTVLLLCFIILYYFTHNTLSFAPVFMGAYRFLIYLLAGSAAASGISGLTIWSGFAMAAYVGGVSYLGRKDFAPMRLSYWPFVFFGVPILLAWVVNGSGYRWQALLLTVLLCGWVGWCLRYALWVARRNVRHTVAGLLAGIVLVDFMAVGFSVYGWFFALWFVAVLALQRVDPAS
jgi:4-hydroxybenzoate polyprenyltransferase